VGVDENPYRAPEAPVIEWPASQSRPFLVFLAGAVCSCASIPFLLCSLLGVRVLFLDVKNLGWRWVLTSRRDLRGTTAIVLFVICGASLWMAGRSFLGRRGRQGRRILLLFAASFLDLVALFFAT
jgi:hypothetical protein